MFYRLSRSVKDCLIDYLRRIYFLYERGDLQLADGSRFIRFTKKPEVMAIDAWERPGGLLAAPGTRVYPVVLIGEVTGKMDFHGFGSNNNLGGFVTQVNAPEGDIMLGGEATLNAAISCVAQSSVERDNLADITAIYLAHPIFAKYAFNEVLVGIESAPSFAGESSVEDVGTDFKMYQTDLTLGIHGQWREVVDKLNRIEELLFDPNLMLPKKP